MRFIVLPLCLMVFGCANPTPSNNYLLVLDDSLPLPIKADAVQAVWAWEKILDHRLSMQIANGHCKSLSGFDGVLEYATGLDPHTICIVGSNAAYVDSVATTEGQGFHIAGFTHRYPDIDTSTIYIPLDTDEGKSDTFMIEMVAHELGHAMGLSHTQPGTLMWIDLSIGSPLPTCDDQAQWSNVRDQSNKDVSCPNGGGYVLAH